MKDESETQLFIPHPSSFIPQNWAECCCDYISLLRKPSLSNSCRPFALIFENTFWRMLVGSTLVSRKASGFDPRLLHSTYGGDSLTDFVAGNQHSISLRRMRMELHHLLSVLVAGATPACSNNLAGQ